MLFNPLLDGQAVFGLAVKIQHVPNPISRQISTFFGVNGQFSMFGGLRGRAFLVEGTLYDLDIPSLNADEANLLNFADGVGHQLYDTRGRTWDNVMFTGDYHADPEGPRRATWSDGTFTYQGWSLRYKMVLHALS